MMSAPESDKPPNNLEISEEIGPLFEFLIMVVVVLLGVILAYQRWWTCDDAFISFRYAENLVNGLGLVYNAGERVEGYTNFLWTIWVALGLRLGMDAEAWAKMWGLVCYGATLTLLGMFPFRMRWVRGLRAFGLPVAALLAALHTDWNIYATGGLETSLFTLLAVFGYMLIVEPTGRWRPVAAGLVFGLASLTRPDGVIFAVLGGVYLLWIGRPRIRSVVVYATAFLMVWVPYMSWRVSYYGDFFPNTYYAKSAYESWYAQGWIYVRLYFAKYWVLALGVPLFGFAVVGARRVHRGAGNEFKRFLLPAGVLAGAFALVYTVYILRVGGGFMYARLLIPATPFYAILLEIGLAQMTRRGTKLLQPVVCGALVLAMVLTPSPLPDRADIHGIVNEWNFYPASEADKARKDGENLRRFFEGLPIRVAFFGGEARMIYYSKVATAIECDTGLTDRFIAHQPLSERGRVGHEKKPTPGYLIDQREVHLIFHALLEDYLGLDDLIPVGGVALGEVRARLLHWDESYDKCRRFYLNHVNDFVREAAFRDRLGLDRVEPPNPGSD